MTLKKLTIVLLLILVSSSLIFAAGTPAGTTITNYATGTYQDANGNPRPQVTSNTVTTTVSQIAGVDVSPPTVNNNVASGGTQTYSFTVTNTGNGTDTFNLSQLTTTTGTFTVTIYHDVDGDGVYTPGVDLPTTSTGSLDADSSYSVLLVITNTGSDPDGTTAVTNLKATSQFNSSVSDTATVTSSITAASITVNISVDNPNPQPGDILTYAVCGANNGTGTAYNVVITGLIPPNTTYVPGSMYIETTHLTDILSDHDGGDFNYTTSNAVTIIWGDAPQGASGCVYYQVRVNDNVPVGTPIIPQAWVDTENQVGDPYPTIDLDGTNAQAIVAAKYAIDLASTVTSGSGDPGDQVLFPFTVTNEGNAPDIVNLTYSASLCTWTFYYDVDGDGIINDGDYILTDTNGDGKIDVGSVPAGSTVHVIGVGTIPAGTSDGASGTLTVTGISVGDPTETDQVQFSVTVTAPSLNLVKSVSPTGNQPPQTVLTYTIVISNSGTGAATQVVVTDVIPTNTTYIGQSMTLGGLPKTDAADGDGATKTSNSVVFTVPQIGPGGSYTATFQVKIN
jgi:uncharacterized repeat protein (TIGR01451 family)